MAYAVNDIDFESFGIIAGRAPSSNLAISGAWDMPARIGKTHHEWGDENGIEPYLRADEIFFGGRDIVFHGFVKGADRPDCVSKVQSFYDALDGLEDNLFTLSCNWGSWQVQVVDAAVVTYMNQGWCNVQIKFRQPVVNINGELPTSRANVVGIDGYSFEQLGIVKTKTRNQIDRPSLRQTETTAYGLERIGMVRRDARVLNLDFFIDTEGYGEFVQVINNLMYLLSLPNARTLALDDGTAREVFAKDGFTVTGVRKWENRCVGFITIPLTEIRLLEQWNLLTDSTGLLLTDKDGRLLTELLKGF